MREITAKKINGIEDNYSFRVISEPSEPSGFWLDVSYAVSFQDCNPLR